MGLTFITVAFLLPGTSPSLLYQKLCILCAMLWRNPSLHYNLLQQRRSESALNFR